MENVKSKLKEIIEHADSTKPACKNCCAYKEGGCTFGCLNEKVKITSPNYSCDNFKCRYDYNESTITVLKDLLSDVERIEESVKNLELLLLGKINEQDFVNLVD